MSQVFRASGVLGRRAPARLLRHGPRVAWLALALAPTLAAGLFYGCIASPRYVSEAVFVIRTASKPAGAIGGLGALLQMVGVARSQDDAWAVHDFLTSRDAVRELGQTVDLRAIYGRKEVDPLSRYPSLLYGAAEEELYLYFQTRLDVIVNSTSGLTTLLVEAPAAADAQRLATTLLAEGEALVNRLNQRSEADAVRVATAEVARAEALRIASQQAITAFRNRELLLDPEKSSAIVLEVIGRLATRLADLRAGIAATRASAPTSPGLPSMEQQALALEREIAAERGRVGNASDGLAQKIAEYEKLQLERDFAIRSLAQAVTALEQARLEARRQQLFLERVVEPGLADEPTMPRRWRCVGTVFGFNVLVWALGWMVVSGLREHASAQRRG
jgi:capsular polysaccharide transport system permease protein